MEKVVLFVCLIFTTSAVFGQKTIKLYHSPNYKGLIYETEAGSGCFDAPSFANDRISSIQTEVCVFAFEHPNCDGMSIKLKPDDPVGKNLQELENITVSSFKTCSEDLGGNDIYVKVYGDAKLSNIQAEYKKVCGCITFPSYLYGELGSIDNHGHCLQLFEYQECQNRSYAVLRAGRSRVSENIKIWNQESSWTQKWTPMRNYKSFKPCEIPLSCYEIQMKAYKIEVISDDTAKIDHVELAPTDTIYNNGSGTITKQFTKTRTITQTVEITDALSLSASTININEQRVEVQSEISVLFSKSVGSWFASLSSKLSFENTLSAYLRSAYAATKEYSQQKSKTMIFTKDQTIAVSQQITIPGYTQYEVRSSMKTMENYPLSYYRYYKVTGKLDGKALEQSVLREHVVKIAGMEVISSPDKNTILARSKGTLIVSTGFEGYITAHGVPIRVVTTERAKNNISTTATTTTTTSTTKRTTIGHFTNHYNKDLSTERTDIGTTDRNIIETFSVVLRYSTLLNLFISLFIIMLVFSMLVIIFRGKCQDRSREGHTILNNNITLI